MERDMIVDLHAHVVPRDFPELDDRVRALVRQDAAFYDPARRLEAMAASGVDAEVLSPLPPLLGYQVAPPRGRDLCREVNRVIAELCAAEPGRFFGLGTVPLQDPDLAAEGLSEVKGSGLHGVEIGSNVGGRSLGEDRFLDFFQEAERLQVPIFVHAYNPTMTDRLPAAAMATFGFATDVALAAASVISGGLAQRCPDLRLAFSHGAGGFPLMLTRAQRFWEARLGGGERAPQSPAEYARRFYYDALVFDGRALRYLIDMVGPSQLLLGTDFPAMRRERPADRTLRSLGLAASLHDAITWDNCFRFLGIEAPAARGAATVPRGPA
jgi:aminocarboxymuconate-semialdehyde decarboxylase